MLKKAFLAVVAAAVAPAADALLRFSCSQLVVERLDPLVNPGEALSPHLHQVVGGNGFNVTMDSTKGDLADVATCTTCTFAEDTSNYWTAVMFFRASNGSLIRVPQKPNVGFERANGGMTIYYTPSLRSGGKVTAFQPGFRMLTGNPNYRTAEEAKRYRQLTYTCLQTMMTRSGETLAFPDGPCAQGIMVNLRFPTCWNGKDLDSADHQSHVAYPETGTFESGGPCPATHPVKVPQLFYEVIWDTTKFNDKSLWPEDGSQPFVWSYGDPLGYGNHGDYVFGWKGEALQTAMDSNCNINCQGLKTQSIPVGNECTKHQTIDENIDGWLQELPGGMPITTTSGEMSS